MKVFSWVAKYVFGTLGVLFGMYIAVDEWVVSKVNTQTEPVKTEVRLFKEYTKAHQERVERELLMIRSTQDSINTFLRERK